MAEAHMLHEHTIELLRTPPAIHDTALELYENGEFDLADRAFQEAADASLTYTVLFWELDPSDDRLSCNNDEVTIARDVMYGRVLLHWALSTEAQYRYERDERYKKEALSIALARACRSLVLLEQDQHRIVDATEIDTARTLIQGLKTEIESIASVPASTVDISHVSFVDDSFADDIAIPRHELESLAA